MEIRDTVIILGISTGCSKFPKEWRMCNFSKKVTQKLLKKSNVSFVTKVAQNLFKKTKKPKTFLLLSSCIDIFIWCKNM